MNPLPFDIYISGGNITIILGTHAPEIINDILHSDLYSKLFAQLKSNDRELLWSHYTNTLSGLKWTIKSREVLRSEFETTNLLELLKQSTENSLLTLEQQALATAFRKLKSASDGSPAIKAILDRLNSNSLATSKQTLPTHHSTSTLLTIVRLNKSMLTVQVSFESTCAMDMRILTSSVIHPIKDDKANVRLLTCQLSEPKYSELREGIIKKLGSKIETQLLHV